MTRTAPIAALIFFLASAAFSFDRPVNTPPIGPTPRNCGQSTVVRFGDGFLALWFEPASGYSQVRATRLDRDGHPIDARSFAVTPLELSSPGMQVASNGKEVFVVTSRYTNAGAERTFYRIDANAAVTRLAQQSATAIGSFSIAATEQYLLLVDYYGPAAIVSLFDRDGHLLRANLPFIQPAGMISYFDVTPAGDGFLAVYADYGDGKARVASLSTASIVAGTVTPIVDVSTEPKAMTTTVRVAVNGSRAMALWVEYVQPGNAMRDVRVRPLTISGVATTSAPIVAGTFSVVGFPSLVPYGDGFLAAFVHQPADSGLELVSAQLTADGQVTSLSRAPLPTDYTIPAAFAAAANGTSAIAAWCETRFVTPTRIRQVVTTPLVSAGAPSIGASSIVSLARPEQHVQALFPTATGAVAVWSEAAGTEHLVVGRFDAVGNPLDGAGLRIRDSNAHQGGAGVAFTGDTLFVAWSELQTSGVQKSSVYLATIPINGLLSPAVTKLTDAATLGRVATSWNGSQLVVAWQRWSTSEIEAMRFNRSGAPLDANAIVLTPPRPPQYFADASPRLSWNGSEYLLVWQRRWYWALPVPILPPVFLVNDLFAQRLTPNLFADGAEIPLAVSPFEDGNDASEVEVASAGGRWLVVWDEDQRNLDYGPVFARIDAAGNRRDPLNGRRFATAIGILPQVTAMGDRWLAGGGTRLSVIAPDGTDALYANVPGSIEALNAAAAQPLVGYSVKSEEDTLARIATVVGRRRAAR